MIVARSFSRRRTSEQTEKRRGWTVLRLSRSIGRSVNCLASHGNHRTHGTR